jgi:hypothetical protein
MAKLALSKLGLKTNSEVTNVTFGDNTIEVKQYLPIRNKMELITNVLNDSADDMKFYNAGKLDMYLAIEVILAYTNITCTEKQREDAAKLYDSLVSSGLYEMIVNAIPDKELADIRYILMETVTSIYQYQNSVMGILDTITQDYSNLDLDASSIQQKLADPENLELLKAIMTKLG